MLLLTQPLENLSPIGDKPTLSAAPVSVDGVGPIPMTGNAAADTVENVRNCAQIAPQTESQARPLTRLEPVEPPTPAQQAEIDDDDLAIALALYEMLQ